MVCAFFGHKDTLESIRPLLESAVKQIIERYPDTTFYVGNNGNFDRMVLSVLKSLSQDFPTISYSVILAYLPTGKSAEFDGLPTIYPDGIECVPKKYAISYRNDWIVKKADMVICYIKHNYGGAAKFVEKARKNGKIVYNLSDNYVTEV
ncbi:MAG: hypothetical protein HDT21_05680 [Ruminococcus sp.]|nr:hypothetical protein [Ruminococcus sp.]